MNLFSLAIPIYLLEDDNFELAIETNREDVITDIINLCYTNEIDHIFITGPEGEMIKEELEQIIPTKYELHDIRIEVKKDV